MRKSTIRKRIKSRSKSKIRTEQSFSFSCSRFAELLICPKRILDATCQRANNARCMSQPEPPLDATIRVITPANIAFEYRLAGPFRRLPAFLLDAWCRNALHHDT